MTWARRTSAGANVAWACHLLLQLCVLLKCSPVSCSTPPFDFAFCVCAMADAAGGRLSGAEESQAEQSGAASAAPGSPTPAPSEASSPGGSSSSVFDQQSDLLQKIKDLVDTQKTLKEQKKRCALEMKNAMKRKKRLQDKASQLSDADLVEVLRMRKAKKDSVQTAATTPPPEESPVERLRRRRCGELCADVRTSLQSVYINRFSVGRAPARSCRAFCVHCSCVDPQKHHTPWLSAEHCSACVHL